MSQFILIARIALSVAACLFLLFSIGYCIAERRKNAQNRKNVFSVDLIEESCIELFDFNTIQPKEALLKKNTGGNPCLQSDDIHYVEYCDAVCNFKKNGKKNQL